MQLDLILIGLVIALEPIPLTAYLLMLSSQRGSRKGFAFLLGWMLTLIGVVVLTLVVTGGDPLKSGSAPTTAALVIKGVIGAGLLWFAARQRRRPGGPSSPPSWMAKIDDLNFGAAMALGFLLQPWPLVAAGVATVTEANLSSASSRISLIAFCLLAAGSYIVIQLYVTVAPVTAEARLYGLQNWITSHRNQVAIWVSAGIGIWLIASSAYLLVS